MLKPNSLFSNNLLIFSINCLKMSWKVALLAVCLPTSQALIIKNEGSQNFRFYDPVLGYVDSAPVNPLFIGKDFDLSGVAVSAMNGGSAHLAGAIMISPHYFVTSAHNQGATSYNFRNRDGMMITKATDGGRTMITTFPNGTTSRSDLYIGKLAGAGITAIDKISYYPIIMESTDNWKWYIGKQIYIYSMSANNSLGINTITQIENSGLPNFYGKSILYSYKGAYPNQAGLRADSGSPWGVISNGQFCAGGTHSAYYGLISENPSYTSVSTFVPAFADQIDAYISESHPGEMVTRLEVFNDAPVVTGLQDITVRAPAVSETLNFTFNDDSLPINAVRTLTATSSDQNILPNSGLVLSGAGSNRTLVITPTVGVNGSASVTITTSDGEATSSKTFNVFVIGTRAVDYPSASGDDAQQASDGTVTYAESELKLGGGRVIGLRFPKLFVPYGAIITSAHIQFTSGTPKTGPASFEIFAQDTFYAGSFADSTKPMGITNRAVKTTSVLWQPADWNTAGEMGEAQRTPDITALIQQVVTQSYWSSGAPSVLIFKGSGERYADAQDKVGGFPAKLTVTFLLPTKNSVSTFTLDSTNDDAEQSNSGTVNLTDNDLELVNDSSVGDQIVGMRFSNISLPSQAVFKSAAIQFTAAEASNGAASLVFRAQLADTATPFTTTANNLSNRTKTTSSVSWVVPTWLTIGDATFSQITPDLTSIVSEVFNQPGWSNGNSLAFFVTGSGRRTAYASDNNLGVPPKLRLTYQALPHPHSYEAWSSNLVSLSASQRGPNVDPDGDQLSNLLEFATGQSATVPNASPISVQKPLNELHLVYSRPRTTYGITYVVEWTDDLASGIWSSTGTKYQIIANDLEMETVRAVIPVLQTNGNVSSQRFARLRVLLGTSAVTATP